MFTLESITWKCRRMFARNDAIPSTGHIQSLKKKPQSTAIHKVSVYAKRFTSVQNTQNVHIFRVTRLAMTYVQNSRLGSKIFRLF